MSTLPFSAPVSAWFTSTFAEPTAAQKKGWPAISKGEHTLILAPTGSGKTLAAFLWALDRLTAAPEPDKTRRCRLLYISPLRALAVDIEKNLRAPLQGIALAGERMGVPIHQPTVAIRTGDTPADERRRLLSSPPDALITTPESLYLMLTSQASDMLRNVRWVIVDEIHALAATKRGAHLAISLERLEAITESPPQRIGLSATQRPLDEIARFLGGYGAPGRPRPVTIVDAGHRKPLELEVVVPIEDMAAVSSGETPGPPRGTLVEQPPTGPAGAAEPRASIWPAIHPRLLELIEAHTTTIVFVNARRLAERLSARLNELAGADVVKAHHGSLAREQRLQIEDDLKAGRLRALVATSSLELGIDMGTVDLVIQVESPGSVARGLQRIGRAGHQVGEPSRGRIFPKFRGDLLESAVVVERMTEGQIEETRYPRNPLDVLAQQIVAIAAAGDRTVDEVAMLVRRAANFADLSDDAFTAVLDMLAGRYPSEEFAELRPRIVWDRVEGTIRARDGAKRLAVTSGGTIPDRGLFGVFLPDGTRVGELDEEMVYESRPGEVFILGASSWRIDQITHDRVIVVPAPGEPGKMPFWKGDRPGRPIELGRAMGAFVRTLRSLPRADALTRLRERHALDEWAANNLLQYLDDQAAVTGAIPDDRTVVIERFCDEIGDWRICVLSPFGARVHAPWALALETRLSDRLGMPVQSQWSDDGIILRLPEAYDTVPVDDLLIDPDDIDDLVVSVLPSTGVFAARFREAAARALLLPRRRPDKRTPLWQQRQRASDLLDVASRYPTFPILLEASRECLRDVFDLPALREVLTDLRARRARVVAVDTRQASPFAQSLLFGWVAVYMYEGDTPLAERRAAALALDRDLLRELVGSDELRELLDPEALADLELELQCLSDRRRARDPDELHDLLRRLGPLSDLELDARAHGDPGAWINALIGARRAISVPIAGETRIAAADDAGRLRDALGVAVPPGLPRAFTEPVPGALDDLVTRFARTHTPFLATDVAARYGIPHERVREMLAAHEAAGRILHGEFRPGGVEREWCDPDVLRQLRRRSLAVLRREIEPVDPEVLGRFLPAWHAIGAGRRGADALYDAVAQLQGVPLAASTLETDILPVRVDGFRAADLDAMCAAGELVWIGAGTLGPNAGGGGDGRVALVFREHARLLAPPPPPADERPAGPIHDAIRELLSGRGASFWPELVSVAGTADDKVVLAALWDLVWSGEVTNDTLVPLRAYLARRPRSTNRQGRPRLGQLSRVGPPAGAGRWSLVAPLLQPEPAATEAAHARALQLLERHGVVTRESVLAEGAPGGFAAVYGILKAMEESGRVRRGYFVAGLGAAQFALPGAVDRLRSLRDQAAPGDRDDVPLILSATDPAQPYGAALPWPEATEGGARPARAAGAFVVLAGGVPLVHLERGARSLRTFPAATGNGAWADALVAVVKDGRLRRLDLERIDGGPARDAPVAPMLRAAGFVDSYRGLIVRG
jgi:ATP-dependent Lhr-like helicase